MQSFYSLHLRPPPRNRPLRKTFVLCKWPTRIIWVRLVRFCLSHRRPHWPNFAIQNLNSAPPFPPAPRRKPSFRGRWRLRENASNGSSTRRRSRPFSSSSSSSIWRRSWWSWTIPLPVCVMRLTAIVYFHFMFISRVFFFFHNSNTGKSIGEEKVSIFFKVVHISFVFYVVRFVSRRQFADRQLRVFVGLFGGIFVAHYRRQTRLCSGKSLGFHRHFHYVDRRRHYCHQRADGW